jgi:hypothetical protein
MTSHTRIDHYKTAHEEYHSRGKCPVCHQRGTHVEFLPHNYGRYVCELNHHWAAPEVLSSYDAEPPCSSIGGNYEMTTNQPPR